MLGFEVTINGKNISAAIENGLLTLILTKRSIEGEESLNLHLDGLNNETNKRLTWIGENSIVEGDEIKIKIKQISQITPPFSIRDVAPKNQ